VIPITEVLGAILGLEVPDVASKIRTLKKRKNLAKETAGAKPTRSFIHDSDTTNEL
jgi:hypothetical protein